MNHIAGMVNENFQFDQLFDLSPDLLCIAGYDGYFKKINPAVSKTLGYSTAELYARPINDFVHPDYKEITGKARDELKRSKPLYHLENKYLTKGGETVWLSWTSFPVPDKELIVAIAKNVTHKKKLEADRNALLARLTSKNKDLAELNISTTADLRVAVHSVLALFDLIEPSRVSDEETVKLLEVLKYAAEKAGRILDNTVDLLAERGKKHVVMEEIDLQDCLNRAVQSINAIVETSGCTIISDFSKARTVKFNKSYMESALLNLITNAIKFACPDRKPMITIYSERVGRRDQVTISDNGSGFDAIAFKRELLTDPDRSQLTHDGKGIGLYLINSQVSALGGEMEIMSTINEGTTVIMKL